MEGLFSLLIFVGLFYVMMRFGCGAHMSHGGRHSRKNEGDHVSKHIDPVCGMEVEANQGYGKIHDTHLHRFCSRECLDKFDADPGSYTQLSQKATGSET